MSLLDGSLQAYTSAISASPSCARRPVCLPLGKRPGSLAQSHHPKKKREKKAGYIDPEYAVRPKWAGLPRQRRLFQRDSLARVDFLAQSVVGCARAEKHSASLLNVFTVQCYSRCLVHSVVVLFGRSDAMRLGLPIVYLLTHLKTPWKTTSSPRSSIQTMSSGRPQSPPSLP